MLYAIIGYQILQQININSENVEIIIPEIELIHLKHVLILFISLQFAPRQCPDHMYCDDLTYGECVCEDGYHICPYNNICVKGQSVHRYFKKNKKNTGIKVF